MNTRRERSRVVSKIASLSDVVDVVRAEVARVGAKPDNSMPDPEEDFDYVRARGGGGAGGRVREREGGRDGERETREGDS